MDLSAEEFDQVAREVFAPIYPVIARQIIDRTGVTKGTCLDLGCGSGYLGLALAGSTELSVCLLDKSPEMLKIADRNIIARGYESRVRTLLGDVQDVPLPDRSVDLAVSRGSIFFWENRVKVFREIFRVLAPGGCACIGGGFGTPELQRQITEKMLKISKEWSGMVKKNTGIENEKAFNDELRTAGIPWYEVSRDDKGLWITMRRTS
ncbi:MAG: Malonyl-(acyl-carrier protein) O-methyltransferase [Firmicutes bacterium ADurb.Bin456]|nr:MAG: Malonyl-(acyl-carrier protein) O-methyltransferase [Firmicutes bacterium ADurb.Bin456]